MHLGENERRDLHAPLQSLINCSLEMESVWQLPRRPPETERVSDRTESSSLSFALKQNRGQEREISSYFSNSDVKFSNLILEGVSGVSALSQSDVYRYLQARRFYTLLDIGTSIMQVITSKQTVASQSFF